MKSERTGVRLAAIVVGCLAAILGFGMAGCHQATSTSPKPKANVTATETSDEGPNRSPNLANFDGASGSNSVPSTAVFITEASDGFPGSATQPAVPPSPARMNLSKPSSTTTINSDPLGLWGDFAGMGSVTKPNIKITEEVLEDDKVVERTVTTFSADAAQVDNKATLEGSAMYATAVHPSIAALSGDTLAAYRSETERFIASVKLIEGVSAAAIEAITRALIPTANLPDLSTPPPVVPVP